MGAAMRGYLKLIFGALLILSSGAGMLAAVDGTIEESAQAIVDNALDTTGVIEKRTKHTVTARKGKIGGRGSYYTMTYSFTTLEGKKYSSEINISKEDAYAVNDGQKIAVRYNKKQPSINAALGFKEYFSQEDVEDLPVGMILSTAFTMLLGGLWLCWSGWRTVQPSFGGVSFGGSNAYTVPENRMTQLNRVSGARAFGQR